MKKYIDSIRVFMVMLLLLLTGCQNADKQINSIILDTDMGNDIDDALALAIMNRYIDEGRTQVLAIGMSKEGNSAAEYTDIVQTWYGHPNIPIALVSGNTGPKTTEKHYSDRVCEMKNDTGTIDVDTLGITRFTPAPDGQHRYLIISDAQVDALTQHLVDMITE